MRPPDTLRILNVGTGRSGTGYTAALLAAASGLAAGHEDIYNPWTLAGLEAPARLAIESSWLAAPYLENVSRAHTIVIHVKRDPLESLRSLVGREWLAGYETTGFEVIARRYIPNADSWRPTKDPNELLERSQAFVAAWAALIDAGRPIYSLHLEDLDLAGAQAILELAGLPILEHPLPLPSRRTNRQERPRAEWITEELLSPTIRQIRRSWGY